MSSPVHPLTSALGAIDPQRLEDALGLIAPKWTTWTAQVLAGHDGPMRRRDIAARLPFVGEDSIAKRLGQMYADGLVMRTDDRPGAPYRLTALGRTLAPVHQALADWSQDQLIPGPMAAAGRAEDAVRRLHLRHTTAMIKILGAGPARFVHLMDQTGLDTGSTRQRLLRLQADGLVTRTGPRHGDPYVLSDAGRALGPVYAAVAHWSDPTARHRTASIPAKAATRTDTTAAPVPDPARTAAALRRSPTVPGGLFSHAPQPQPRVPAAVTSPSVPVRGR